MVNEKETNNETKHEKEGLAGANEPLIPPGKKLVGLYREQVKEDIRGWISSAVDEDRHEAMNCFCNRCPGKGTVCFSGDGYCPEVIEFGTKDDFWFSEEMQERVLNRIMDIATLDPSPRCKNLIRSIAKQISVSKSMADNIIHTLTVTTKPNKEKPKPPVVPTECPLCAAQGIKSPMYENNGHYQCELCDYNIYPKLEGADARYKHQQVRYTSHQWPGYIETGTRNRAGYQEHESTIKTLRSMGYQTSGFILTVPRL